MQKEAAVASEDYDTAKQCKLQITELQKLAAQIAGAVTVPVLIRIA